MTVLVGIIMGSKSDWPTMQHTADMLDKLGVSYEVKVVSAHRTPDLLFDYAKTAQSRGIKVIVAGAGGAAHFHSVPSNHKGRIFLPANRQTLFLLVQC